MPDRGWQIWYHDYFDRDLDPSLEAEGTDLDEGLTVLWRRTLDEAFFDDGRPTFTAFTFKYSRPIDGIPRHPLENPELARLRRWRHERGVLDAIVGAHARVGVAPVLAATREATSASDLVARLRALLIPPHHDPACWGCGDAPGGIRLPSPEQEGLERYEATFSFDEGHQGGPGIVHGGLVSAALDEACGLLATWYRFPTVTARIFVRFRRPVPINTELSVASWVTGSGGRRIHIDGELRAGGEVLAEARAAFLHVPLEHFLATPEGRAAGEAWRSRLGA